MGKEVKSGVAAGSPRASLGLDYMDGDRDEASPFLGAERLDSAERLSYSLVHPMLETSEQALLFNSLTSHKGTGNGWTHTICVAQLKTGIVIR